jgi:hypothetical protein
MIRIAICAVAAALAVDAARAQAQPAADEAAAMHDYFGAALEISAPWQTGGGVSITTRYYAPDHTFHEVNEEGEAQGSWTIEDGKICATRTHAPRGQAARYCNIGLGKTLGQQWQDTDPVTGNAVFFQLMPKA